MPNSKAENTVFHKSALTSDTSHKSSGNQGHPYVRPSGYVVRFLTDVLGFNNLLEQLTELKRCSSFNDSFIIIKGNKLEPIQERETTRRAKSWKSPNTELHPSSVGSPEWHHLLLAITCDKTQRGLPSRVCTAFTGALSPTAHVLMSGLSSMPEVQGLVSSSSRGLI